MHSVVRLARETSSSSRCCARIEMGLCGLTDAWRYSRPWMARSQEELPLSMLIRRGLNRWSDSTATRMSAIRLPGCSSLRRAVFPQSRRSKRRPLPQAAVEGRWATCMRLFAGPKLLVIDELGYLPLPGDGGVGIAEAHMVTRTCVRRRRNGPSAQLASVRSSLYQGNARGIGSSLPVAKPAAGSSPRTASSNAQSAASVAADATTRAA